MKAHNMHRDRALLKFKKHFFHNTRNGQDPETAATNAMWMTREETLALIMQDTSLASNFDREEAWADALIDIMLFRQLLVDLKQQTPSVMPQHHLPSTSSSAMVDTITAGIEKQEEIEIQNNKEKGSSHGT